MRIGLSATIAIAILLSVAACAGSGPAPEATATVAVTATPVARPPLPDPAALYSAMAANILGAPSLHASATFREAEESGMVEIGFLPPDRAQLTLALDSPDKGPVSSEAIIVGKRLFIRFEDLQGWFEVPADDEGFADIKGFMEFFPEVLAATPSLVSIAEETLGEAPTYHIQGTLDREVLNMLGQAGEDDTATVDVWVGVEDTLPRRLLVQTTPSSFTLDISISPLDAPLPIEVPDTVVSLDIFDQLAGGSPDPDALSELVSILPDEAQECIQTQLGEGALDDLFTAGSDLSMAQGLALQSCLGDILVGLGRPEELEAGVSEIVGGASELLGLLPPEAEECIKEAVGSDVYEEWTSGQGMPTLEQLLALGPCTGGFDIGDVGESDLDVPDTNGLAQILDEFGPGVEGCLRSVWGDTAFEELKSGARQPNLSELGAMPGCIDTQEDGGGDEGSGDVAPDLPEDLGAIVGQLPPQVQECLAAAVGEDAIRELGDGSRLPDLTEVDAITTCFEQFEAGQ